MSMLILPKRSVVQLQANAQQNTTGTRLDLNTHFCYCLLQASWSTEGSSLPVAWPQSGTIELQDYGLQYRKGLELALKDITLHINPKEKVIYHLLFVITNAF